MESHKHTLVGHDLINISRRLPSVTEKHEKTLDRLVSINYNIDFFGVIGQEYKIKFELLV
jgi:hypothetical protein